MPLEKIDAPYVRNQLPRFQQGDILRDLTISEVFNIVEDNVEVRERTLPYSVVLSQDCDLEHDYACRNAVESKSQDKALPFLMLCPAYLAEPFRAGEHLVDENKKMQKITSDEWRKLKTNQVLRFHYLEAWQDLQVPELVIDFKHYFTVPCTVLYREELRKSYLATIEILYREHVSSRFAHYFSRIGLPELTSP